MIKSFLVANGILLGAAFNAADIEHKNYDANEIGNPKIAAEVSADGYNTLRKIFKGGAYGGGAAIIAASTLAAAERYKAKPSSLHIG